MSPSNIRTDVNFIHPHDGSNSSASCDDGGAHFPSDGWNQSFRETEASKSARDVSAKIRAAHTGGKQQQQRQQRKIAITADGFPVVAEKDPSLSPNETRSSQGRRSRRPATSEMRSEEEVEDHARRRRAAASRGGEQLSSSQHGRPRRGDDQLSSSQHGRSNRKAGSDDQLSSSQHGRSGRKAGSDDQLSSSQHGRTRRRGEDLSSSQHGRPRKTSDNPRQRGGDQLSSSQHGRLRRCASRGRGGGGFDELEEDEEQLFLINDFEEDDDVTTTSRSRRGISRGRSNRMQDTEEDATISSGRVRPRRAARRQSTGPEPRNGAHVAQARLSNSMNDVAELDDDATTVNSRSRSRRTRRRGGGGGEDLEDLENMAQDGTLSSFLRDKTNQKDFDDTKSVRSSRSRSRPKLKAVNRKVVEGQSTLKRYLNASKSQAASQDETDDNQEETKKPVSEGSLFSEASGEETQNARSGRSTSSRCRSREPRNRSRSRTGGRRKAEATPNLSILASLVNGATTTEQGREKYVPAWKMREQAKIASRRGVMASTSSSTSSNKPGAASPGETPKVPSGFRTAEDPTIMEFSKSDGFESLTVHHKDEEPAAEPSSQVPAWKLREISKQGSSNRIRKGPSAPVPDLFRKRGGADRRNATKRSHGRRSTVKDSLSDLLGDGSMHE